MSQKPTPAWYEPVHWALILATLTSIYVVGWKAFQGILSWIASSGTSSTVSLNSFIGLLILLGASVFFLNELEK